MMRPVHPRGHDCATHSQQHRDVETVDVSHGLRHCENSGQEKDTASQGQNDDLQCASVARYLFIGILIHASAVSSSLSSRLRK